MKTRSSLRFLVFALIASSAALATADPKDDTKGSNAGKVQPSGQSQPVYPGKNDGVILTGSNIKQSVRRAGRITDGANSVIVIDRVAIDHSGAQDLKQLLRQQGIGR